MGGLKARLATLLVSMALTVDQALAMSWWNPDHGHGSGSSGPASAPELDGTGAIAVFALIGGIAIVLFNRARNK
ncbi:hypothetical protein [Hyphomicrobium sp.]|uniref:hypothetical protein n=1 Tax=Hyphomicrobium sp. TaxID=82 RepID=UPI002FE2BB89